MRNIIFTFLLFITHSVSAQYGQNSFSDAEKTSDHVNKSEISDNVADGKPGNPDGEDDLPIDDYIPLLILTALGIIIYKTRKNRNLLS